MFEDPVTVPDPDLQISSRPLDKGEGGPVSKKIFSTLRASVWTKNKGRGGRPGPLLWIRHCVMI